MTSAILRRAQQACGTLINRFLFIAVAILLLDGGAVWAAGPLVNEPVAPIPQAVGLDPKKVTLGERLFNDVRLSRDNTISCASCHVLARGGADNRIHSYGVGGVEGAINAPTVFNSGLNFVQFWDGRAATLEEQVDGPLHNPLEMASEWEQVIKKLRRNRDLVSLFVGAYEDGITAANVRDAIAVFERSLNTVDSPFDRYLLGDENAIGPSEKRGYLLFKSYGCASCHQGAAVGGNMYQTMGVLDDYVAKRGTPTPADLGRYNVTRDERDRYVFKVPSLRLSALTGPYFHDGSAATLDDAINVMARYQLGRSISPSQRKEIAAFLRSLTGKHPRLAP